MSTGVGIGVGVAFGRTAASVPPLHTDGIISEWMFSEGSGSTVADEQGSNAIDLTLPTSPNATWTSTGIATASGLVQTPSITGARTVAFLYKVTRGQTAGFALSGGSASGAGILGDFSSYAQDAGTGATHVGVGGGIAPVKFRDTGAGGFQLNRAGWVLCFVQFATGYNTPFGFGGRHSTTTSRCAAFDIAWAACWNDVLTDSERAAVYDYVRAVMLPRSIYIDYRDCSTVYDGVLLWGQSNADGRALISNLSSGDQSNTTPSNVSIAAIAASNGTDLTVDSLDMGVNQKAVNFDTEFGPEMGAAWQWELNEGASGNVLTICKCSVGSTYLAPSAITGGGPNLTWNADELVTNGLLWGGALRHWYDFERSLLASGIGIRLRGLWWMQGEQDATNTIYSADYDVHIGEVWDAVKTYTSHSDLHMVIARIREEDPLMNATAATEVRADQSSFAAANSDVTLVDTDSFALKADNVHYNAAGMKALGEAFYSNKGW